MTEKTPSKLQQMKKGLKAITVEPVGFLMLTGSMLASTASQTLALDKTCRVNLNLSETICDALRTQNSDNFTEYERMVQEHVATLAAYKSIITSVLPCILLIFAGGWMDLTGRRKIIMLLSVIGETLGHANNIINVILFYQLKVEYLMFLEGILGSMFGGWALLFLAVFSYITDITTEKDRTFRLGLVNFSVFIGMPIGIALSGILLKTFGYLTVYIITLSMGLINASYLIFVLSDPVRTKQHKEHDNRGFVYFLKIFFNPSHFMNSLRVVFKKTTNNRALRLCILFAATCFIFGPMYGEGAVMLMSTRYRFGWDELQYSLFQAFNMVINVIGSMFCIIVLSKKLGYHDSILGIVSTSSKIAATFVYCFAATGTVFYLGPVADIFNGSAFLAMRSIFSKTVEPHEIGKLNSLVGIFEVIMPLAYVPVYTQVYTATMEFFPGFIFLLGTFLTIPPLLVFIWIFYRHRKSTKAQTIDEPAKVEESS